MNYFVDSHAHLEALEDIKFIKLRSKEAGVTKIISCGSSIEWSRKCVDIAEKESGNICSIYACCGIHPQDGKDEVIKLGDKFLDDLKTVAQSSEKVVAIGECGLDYYLQGDSRYTDTDKEFQQKLFILQIKLANELGLPLVVHCRNAWKDTLSILEQHKKHLKKSGMFHSWTGGLDEMKRALKLGFRLSFSGIVTFKNAGEILDVAKKVPSDMMLVETDSPFLAPVPYRGKKNEPKNVRITAQFLSQLRSVSLERIAEDTTRNCEGLFGI